MNDDSTTKQLVAAFWDSVPPVWHRVRYQVHTFAAEDYDLTGQQFHILRRIRSGAISVSQLAEAKRISRPAISRSVEVLVKKNLINRTQNPQDRRNIRLALTEEGQALFDEVFGKVGQWMEEKLSTLDDEELEAISQALRTLKEAIVSEGGERAR